MNLPITFLPGKLILSYQVCVASEWELTYGKVSNLASIYEFLSEKIFWFFILLDFFFVDLLELGCLLQL